MTTLRTSVLIVGGGCGGVAAALGCARNGARCIITEPTQWLGGQLTSQAVPPDENAWIEGSGPHAPAGFRACTASYTELRDRVRAWYREHRPLTDAAMNDARLNPGQGWVSRLCAEPRVFEQVIRDMLAPHVAEGLIDVRTGLEPVSAHTDGNHLTSVTFHTTTNGGEVTIEADLFLEATELGGLLDLARIESHIGAESSLVFGESHARQDLPPDPSRATDHDPLDEQAFSWCFAMEHRPGEDHTIERPESYAFWRDYIPEMTPPWTGRLFDWTVPSHDARNGRELPLVPWPYEPDGNARELWRYRRIVSHDLHHPDRADDFPDVCLVNWVQMDHWKSPLLSTDRAARTTAFDAAKAQSRCLLYWMQTEAPRHDGGVGYPGLRLRGDELGTGDGFAMAPYIREPRRVRAQQMVTEQHLGFQQRTDAGEPNMNATPLGAGEPFWDSIAIGHYHIDLHPSCAGRNNVYVPATPFRLPLRALVPVEVRNVLAAGKALGVSHVANGCTRLHPVEWAVGEAAGLAAAYCINERTEPHAITADVRAVRSLQEHAAAQGMPIAWPWDNDFSE